MYIIFKGSELKNIFAIRNENDASRLVNKLENYEGVVVVIGSGFLGIERYCKSGPYLEVVAQVELINKYIFSQLESLDSDSWVSLSLESLLELDGCSIGGLDYAASSGTSSFFGLELS